MALPADAAPLAPGDTAELILSADITSEPDDRGKHWHIYPQPALHSGVERPTQISVRHDSPVITADDVRWPSTRLIRNALGEFQPVYEGQTEFRIPLSIAEDASAGDYEVTVDVSYQACATLCLPPATEQLSVRIPVTAPAPDGVPGNSATIDSSLSAEASDGPVLVRVSAEPTTAGPGETVTVRLRVDVDSEPDDQGRTWHIYPRADDHEGVEIASRLELTSPDGVVAGPPRWPTPETIINTEGAPQPAYSGSITIEVPVEITETATNGQHPLKVAFTFQACASRCLIPTTLEVETALRVVGGSPPDLSSAREASQQAPAASESQSPPHSPEPQPSPPSEQSPAPSESAPQSDDVESGDESADEATPGQSPGGEPDESTGAADSRADREDFATQVFGATFEFSGNRIYTVPLLLLFAGVGGFLLNLTPCVLPIIPIKIMGLTQSAGGEQRRTRILGVAMGLGILAFWLAIGAAISFISGFDSISSLFQRPAFGIAVGLFIAFMGFGMLIDMSIELPQAVHRINPRHDTLHGAFLFGVMTAVLSTPCTAPFMGSAAAWATRAESPALVLGVFAAIAVGMGWPYVLMSWYPQLVKRVPRTGPASVLVKQVMGMLMLAVAAFFGGTGLLGLIKEHPHLGPVLHWWVATAVVGVMAVWLALQTYRITRSVWKRVGWTLLGLVLFAGMAIWSNGETADSFEATTRRQMQRDAMESYIAQLETAVEQGSSSPPAGLKPPPWRDYDAEAVAQATARGQVAVVHFTADW